MQTEDRIRRMMNLILQDKRGKEAEMESFTDAPITRESNEHLLNIYTDIQRLSSIFNILTWVVGDVPPEPERLQAALQSVSPHYRSKDSELPPDSDQDLDLIWPESLDIY